MVEPISSKAKELLRDHEFLNRTLCEGAKRAEDIAHKSISEIKKIIGVIFKE